MPKLVMKSAFSATLLGLLAGPALAQATDHQPKTVLAGTYKVEPEHTRVLFSVSHMGFTTYYGEFTGASGSLVLDPKNPAASHLDVTLPIATVSTPSTKLTGELKGKEWLDAAAYPSATFKSTSVTLTGPDNATVAGTLTLHGVSRPMSLAAHFNGAGTNPLDKAYTTGFEVSGKIRRSDFGVKTYVPLIGDDVTLIISAAFEK